MKRQDLGYCGEESASLYLTENGYEVLERRKRIGHSEIDIIARDKDGSTVFVEVKTRRMNPENADFYSTAGAAVDDKKQSYLVRAVEEYLLTHTDESVRIDVIEVYADPDSESYHVLKIIHTENAVRKNGKFSMKRNRYR